MWEDEGLAFTSNREVRFPIGIEGTGCHLGSHTCGVIDQVRLKRSIGGKAAMKYVLAFDQGTTSSRAILFDRTGSIVGLSQQELTQHYPRSGWVEHDAKEIWQTQLDVAQRVLAEAQVSAKEIAAIGITNQRETTVLWERKTGEPIHPAIVWQDRRTAGFCDDLGKTPLAEKIRAKTGLLVDPYFCASKIAWLLANVPGAR